MRSALSRLKRATNCRLRANHPASRIFGRKIPEACHGRFRSYQPRVIDRTVEAVIRIAVIAALVGWCFIIAKPFLAPILGGAIIAVTVFQGYQMLEAALGGRRFAAAVLVTLFMLVMLVVPSVLLGDSLVTGVNKLVDSFQSGQLSIPPPPDSVARWPVIGEPIARFWTLASQDLS